MKLTKIEKIKQVAIKTISSQGYGNTTVAKIAQEANVSVGYLYRHYESKKELINHIVSDMYETVLNKINEILDKNETVEEICDAVIDFYYSIYNKDQDKIKFLVMLVNDFGTETATKQKEYITNFRKSFYDIFITKKGVRAGIEPDEIYIALITVPLQNYAYRLRGLSMNDNSEQDNNKLIKRISLRILK